MPARRDVGAWDLMPRIFGMEEARKQDEVCQTPLAGSASGRLSPARRERMPCGYALRPARRRSARRREDAVRP